MLKTKRIPLPVLGSEFWSDARKLSCRTQVKESPLHLTINRTVKPMTMTMTMTMDLFQLRAHEGQKIIGEILHTMIEHN